MGKTFILNYGNDLAASKSSAVHVVVLLYSFTILLVISPLTMSLVKRNLVIQSFVNRTFKL